MQTRAMLRRTMTSARTICLALQGGGALGAFTWGVLDALLRGGVRFEALSGASAGAVNAVVLADALIDGDAEEAREKLTRFWRKISNAFPWSGSFAAPAALAAFDLMPIPPSPARLNPFGLNPLRDLLAEIDFPRLRRKSPVQLFVAATRVEDGRARIFHTHEMTLEAVLASACLPQLQQAVEIDGEAYWDGGYSANPPIMELVRATRSPDLVVVELTTPLPSNGESRGKQIEKRLRDFALSAPLQRELDTLLDLQRMCRAEPAARSRLAHHLKALRLHRISAQAHLAAAANSNPFDLNWTELTRLSDSGRSVAEAWMRDELDPGAAAAGRA